MHANELHAVKSAPMAARFPASTSRSSVGARSVVEEIVDALHMDLRAGRLVAGQAVRERDLAERFGVSRTPAREAINRLIAHGLLTQADSARGATVLRPTVFELQELYEIRLRLEPMAAELAAANATAAMRKNLKAQVENLDGRTGPSFLEGHLELHLAIAAAAGRPLLYQLIKNLRSRSDPYVRMYLGMGQREHAQVDHHRIVDAIVRGDAATASAETREHLERTIEDVRPFLESELADSRTASGRA